MFCNVLGINENPVTMKLFICRKIIANNVLKVGYIEHFLLHHFLVASGNLYNICDTLLLTRYTHHAQVIISPLFGISRR